MFLKDGRREDCFALLGVCTTPSRGTAELALLGRWYRPLGGGAAGASGGYLIRVAELMVIGVVGTFWYGPLLPVATPLILSTTSMPSVTLPNTQ